VALNLDLIVTMFQKEIGVLKKQSENDYGNQFLYSWTFLHKKSNTLVKILLLRPNDNLWVLHHELSIENPFVLKKVAAVCGRLQTLLSGKSSKIELSQDLEEIRNESILTTMIKSSIHQLLLRKFVLFK
jgi:hypothetical protein